MVRPVTPAKTPTAPTVEVQARSWLCIATPPAITGDGDSEREWMVRLGPGDRRPVRPGDHLDLGHELVALFPTCFAPSPELPDTTVSGPLTAEARARIKAAQAQRQPVHARLVKACCARCGAESDPVVLLPQPQALDLNSELAALDDTDREGRWAIEQRYAAAARAHQATILELDRVEGAFRATHQLCPEGAPALPEPEIPANPALFYRGLGVDTLAPTGR